MKLNRKLRTNKNLEAFADHFRLLGLRRGECRTNIIRSAAQATSVALSDGDNPAVSDHVQRHSDDLRNSDDLLRARIALATYRLLDPRERSDIYERVQLCYPIDRDDVVEPSASATKLIDQMPTVTSKTQRPKVSGVKLVGQPSIGEASDGKSSSEAEPGVGTSLNSPDSAGTVRSLEERRNVAQMLSNSEESSLRNLSPLGWLRSRLGI